MRSYQWGLDVIGDPATSSAPGSGIVVAVVDSGADLGHEDLQGQLIPGYDFVDDDANPQDANGHGTHVAGIIGAKAGNDRGVAGVASAARIMPVRVLDAEGSGFSSDVTAGVRWAADQGADVINLSLADFGRAVGGSLFDGEFSEALEYAWAKGSVPVIAAGNEQFFSSGYVDEHALVVTATDRTDAKPSYASAVGSARWGMAAPGGGGGTGPESGILSTYFDPSKPNAYAVTSGTSMAAPHVAGAAAVLLSLGATPQQVVDTLLATAKDVGPDGRDTTFGAGRLDLAAAVRSVSPSTATTGPAPTAAPTTKPARRPAPAATTPRVTAAPAPPSTTAAPAPVTSEPATTQPELSAAPAQPRRPATEVAAATPSSPAHRGPSRVPLTALAAGLWLLAGAGLVAARRH